MAWCLWQESPASLGLHRRMSGLWRFSLLMCFLECERTWGQSWDSGDFKKSRVAPREVAPSSNRFREEKWLANLEVIPLLSLAYPHCPPITHATYLFPSLFCLVFRYIYQTYSECVKFTWKELERLEFRGHFGLGWLICFNLSYFISNLFLIP